MNPLLRKILALVAGVVVGALVVGCAEYVGHSIYPPPTGINVKDPEDLKRLMDVVPFQAKLIVVVAWFLGALAGAWTAIRLGGETVLGFGIGGIFAGLSIMTMLSIPHPLWMTACAVVLPFAAAWLAIKISAKT